MDLMDKIRKLNCYYNEKGLIETFELMKNKGGHAILKKYPFKYRYPSMITMEIMDICNLKCAHCYLQAQTGFTDKGFIDYDFFERVIERISHLIKRARVFNFGSVEALFHKRIFDMIDLVMDLNNYISININTNGMLLDENRIHNLIKRKISNFFISLDGCRKETVESFKAGVDFDRVVSNIKKLNEIGGNKVRIVANFVANENNINEIVDYIDLCKSIGVTAINIAGFISYTPEMAKYCLYSESGMKKVDEIYLKAKQRAESVGMELRHLDTRLEAIGCGIASELMYIDKRGNIVPCVLFSKKTRMVLLDKVGTTKQIIWGNVFEEEPYKIWTSKASIDFRRLLYEKKLPIECSLCAIGYNVIC